MVIKLLKQKSLANLGLGTLSVTGGNARLYVPGQLFSWGYNRHGELAIGIAGEYGSGNYTRSSPVQVGALATWTYLSCGWNSIFGRTTDGKLWAWGENDGAYLGVGDLVNRSSPTQVGSATNWVNVTSGSNSSSGGVVNGQAYIWGGISTNNPPFLPSPTRSATPVLIPGRSDWNALNFSAHWATGIIGGGKLYAWGENDWGQLGLGYYTAPFHGASSPTQVGSRTDWQMICPSKNLTNIAMTTDGNLWGWGKNSEGECGILSATARIVTPTVVVGGHTWKKSRDAFVLGTYHTLAIDSSGYLWAWGNNNWGQLGLGLPTSPTAANVSSPVQVGALKWRSVAAGWRFSVGVTQDGRLFTWGKNQYCQLGLGVSSYGYQISSPVQVGTGTKWISCWAGIYTGFAIRAP